MCVCGVWCGVCVCVRGESNVPVFRFLNVRRTNPFLQICFPVRLFGNVNMKTPVKHGSNRLQIMQKYYNNLSYF